MRKIFRVLRKNYKKIAYIGIVAGLLFFGGIVLWATTINMPNLDSFEERVVAQSTKIYDRTGEVILYDVFGEYKRTVVPLDQISDNLEKATISIEDKNFYTHNGIEISSIFRAVFKNISDGSLLGGQGGSTITQQVIKNALLTREKTISRKLKEWILAPRLENLLSKDQILEIYLNEIPYGGNVYGIQEASRRYFAKDAKDLTLAESAYLAALPQAPTYYSPYGNHKDKLEQRKNLVLEQMYETGQISKEEMENTKNEVVAFQKQENFGIRAPHFVMYVLEQLEKEYGKEAIEEGGLKVTTTLDWELEKEAEDIVKRFAFENEKTFNAENGAIVATDPNNGDVLVMVGSRDYFDEKIDGNFNITTAERQPGSAFKPIVYAEAFNKGYRPETVVFDLATEFSTTCSSGGSCYSPENYDHIFRGPMTLRDALAQSVNIPAVKVLYLAGIKDALNLAKNMGLETLTKAEQYGLTLVLGGGEVRPLDMAHAYGIFAKEGTKYPIRSILKVEDSKGKVLFEEKEPTGERVLSEQTSRLISDVLSDNGARSPAFGSNSFLNIATQDVAVKTGTTNDYRDAWIVGYTPNISVAAWAGNNDNESMEKKVAGFIVAPMWRAFMDIVLTKRPVESFNPPEGISPGTKPIIAGMWKGEEIEVIDTTTGKTATNETSPENKKVVVTGGGGNVHSILHWVNKSNPLGPSPSNPGSDPQYYLWEEPVRSWVKQQGGNFNVEPDDVNEITRQSKLDIVSPTDGEYYLKNSVFVVAAILKDGDEIEKGAVYINGRKVGELDSTGDSFSFVPEDVDFLEDYNELRVKVEASNGKDYEKTIHFGIK